MKKSNILATTAVLVFFVWIGSSFATVFNEGTPVFHSDYQHFSPYFNTPPEDNVRWADAEGIKSVASWKIVVWFSLWLVAFSLWATIPVTKNEDE